MSPPPRPNAPAAQNPAAPELLDSLERRIVRVETALILLAIAAIGTADYFVGRQLSLGPLYLIPVSYSALTHRARTTALLVLVCLGLRQWFGPLQSSSDPWFFFVRDLLIAAVFVAAVGTLHRLGRQRRQFFDVARRQRDELAREIEVAADLQRRLLTLNQPHIETLDVVAHVEPLKGVGGDYYDFIGMPDGRVCIVIADVAGKGLKAALLMPALRIALRSIVSRVAQPDAIVRELNDVLCETTEPSSYATLFLACLEPATGALTCVNAGHLPGLLRDREGRVRRLSAGGPPVGLLADAAYESETALLDPGAAVVLFTDGVTEAFRGADEEFGIDRLLAGVEAGGESSAQDLVSSIRRALDAFLGGHELTDDLTLIAVRRA